MQGGGGENFQFLLPIQCPPFDEWIQTMNDSTSEYTVEVVLLCMYIVWFVIV